MKKIFACDLDGTLVNKNIIAKEDLEAIKLLRKAGYLFVISTGRTLYSVNELVSYYNLKYDYLILCNGSLLLDSNQNIIEHNHLPINIGMSLLSNYFHRSDICFSFGNGIDKMIVETRLNENFKNKRDICHYEQLILNDKLACFTVHPINKSFIQAEKLKLEIQKHKDSVEIYRNTYFVDIIPKDCSKGLSVEKIKKITGLKDVFAIGDSYNDISMFSITKNSYAISHADYGVKKYAKKTAVSVQDCINDIIGK